MRRAAAILLLTLWVCAGAFSAFRTRESAAVCLGVPESAWILIELDLKRLTLYEGARQVLRFPIASGAWATPSPVGVFRINGRFRTEMSGFGTRFLSLNVPWGQYGIHGTNKPASIGGNASHGCIRLRVRDAEALYARVPNGAKVVIEGGAYGLLGDGLRTLRPGDRGSHVQAVQLRMRQLSLYTGTADGIYGAGTSRAVLAARKAYGLNRADIVDGALYKALGMLLFE